MFKEKSNNILNIYLVLFFSFLACLFFTWPIGTSPGDTDLWFHLKGGKFFFENGKIPTSSYFSFIDPVKEFKNYYWLFQVILFKIFKFFNYYGLIIFRSLIYLGTTFLIYAFLIKNQKKEHLFYGTLFFAIYAFAILPRELFLIRPHVFSYLFIVVFLYILEYQLNLTWILPVIIIFWSNIHGIEYPVALFIPAVYLLEFSLDAFRKNKQFYHVNLKHKIFIILTLYCVLINPYTIDLFKTPFELSPFANQAINEMTPITIKELFIFNFFPDPFLSVACQKLLIFFIHIFAFISLINKNFRISHIIILFTSDYLLFSGSRFYYEAILLCLPIIKNGLNFLFLEKKEPKKIVQSLFGLIIFIIVPAFFLYNMLQMRQQYPVDHASVPNGIVKFLNHLDVEAKVFNTLNYSGFTEWALNSKYKIYMDLQMSLFSETDFFFAQNARTNKVVFESFIKKYDPSFICLSLKNTNFKKIIETYTLADFVLIFFDDLEVLYVNKKHFPEIASKYELKNLDPFEINESYFKDEKNTKPLKGYIGELLMIEKIYNGSALIKAALSFAYQKEGDYENAKKYAEMAVEICPDHYIGYFLMGQISSHLKKYEESIDYLKKCMKKKDGDNDFTRKLLHTAYSKLKRFDKAYNILLNNKKIFDRDMDYKNLFQLALYASASGKTQESIILLKMAQLKTPKDDLKHLEMIENLLSKIK